MGQAVGNGAGEYNLIDYSPYFAGENTIKVLGGDNNFLTAKNNIAANGGFLNYSRSYEDLASRPVVYGMPIHPDDDGDYVQYGVGVQKRWGDRFTGFFQVMLRNGGRNGVAFSAGFRWVLGK